MRNDGSAPRQLSVLFGEGYRLEFVRKAVEAKTSHTALPGIPGQGKDLLHHGNGVMKSSVETRYLRQFWIGIQQGLDDLQRVRLMEGRERNAGFEIREHGGIHAHGLEILAASVDDAMRDRKKVA